MNTGIYKIKNLVNGKFYIGSAVNFNARFRIHLCMLRKGKHHSISLQRAWKKYGENSFAFEKLLVCKKGDLIFYEQRAIDAYGSVRNGYNINPTAGSNAGRVASESTRAKISAAGKGRKQSAESIEKTRLANLGRKVSDETRKKLSASTTKTMSDPDVRAKAAATQTGKVYSAESRAKMAIAKKGKKISDEAKANMSESQKTRWANTSPERRAEICESLSKKFISDEARANMSAAAKLRGISQETRDKSAEALRGKKRTPESVAKQMATRAANKAAKSPQQESA